MTKLPFALQLYTVRDHLEQDPPATLKRVKEIGYDYVETAGFAGRTAAEFKILLAGAGLTPVSAHVGFEQLMGDLDAVIAQARALGVHYTVVSSLGAPLCVDKPTWLAAIRKMDAAGARLRQEGIQLCYHNHAHEFERLDGEYIFDIIYANSAAQNVAIQLDTCWADVGGADTLALMRKYGHRIVLLHAKDYVRDAAGQVVFKELGRGGLSWDPIFDAAKTCHVAWYIVEQDMWEGDSLESARISAEFMALRRA